MLEKYVCNLEHAKKLKELGVKQDGEHYHIRYGDLEGWKSKVATKFEIAILQNNYDVKIIAFAPCVGELGEILPRRYKTARYIRFGKEYYLCYFHHSLKEANTEANARASMVEYLIENKLMKV